jgi:hypothetical protein
MVKNLENLAEKVARDSAKSPIRDALSKAISEIARRGAEHEKEMERIRGEMSRGARAGRGRFRI